ncbi:MAG: hypothetical protein AVDCRST_MAG42-2443 [uncultured Chthoniobacterales bacterium]|uniref:Nucleotidyltransferase family protein n=1 Tax=uncultured Chthoniobacterales bacterium TaxID=1836801 RepID=A0A6J4IFP4_9BACT|nr:MAG: hypothetical protein AVDCRST_MAG42-2443 [uncultured Chthoniobacterales bacterium]
MTATEAYESVTNGGASDFAAVVEILREHGPWCLIGGLAINCHVEPVYTLDADIVVLSQELATIAERLRHVGFSLSEFPHSTNAQRGAGRLNIQFTTDPRYQEFVTAAAEADVLGLRVPIATIENLVRGKVWAWSDKERRLSKRKKDELDLIRIADAYPRLRHMMPPGIVSQLENG